MKNIINLNDPDMTSDYSWDGDLALALAMYASPISIITDAFGNSYIVDVMTNRIAMECSLSNIVARFN